MTATMRPADADRFDTEVLQRHWIPLADNDIDTAAVLRERLGVDFSAFGDGHRVVATEQFVYLPITATYQRGEAVHRARIVFAIGNDFLVTLQPEEHFLPFDGAVVRMRHEPALVSSPRGVMYALLAAVHETSQRLLHDLDDLDDLVESGTAMAEALPADPAARISRLRAQTARLIAAEEAVSLIRLTQRDIERAARRLGAPAMSSESGAGQAVLGRDQCRHDAVALAEDAADIGVRAALAHDKIIRAQRAVARRSAIERDRALRAALTGIAVVPVPVAMLGGCGSYALWASSLGWEIALVCTVLLVLGVVLLSRAYVTHRLSPLGFAE